MHDARRTVGQRFADLGDAGGAVAIEIGIGRGGAGHGDLTDQPALHDQVVRPCCDGGIVDADQPHLVRRHRAADAGARALLGARPQRQQFATFDDRDRQAFGGAVGRPELRVRWQQFEQGRDHIRGHRRTGRHHRLQSRQRLAVVGQHPHQRRRTEQLIHAETRDRRVQFARVGLGWPGRIHVGNDRGRAQCGIEQRERRKRRQIRAARRDAEGLAHHRDLRHEMTMTIDHALGHASGAAGEQDRGDIVGLRVRELRAGVRTIAFDFGQRRVGQDRARAGGDAHACAARPAQQHARELRQRNTDEGLGLRFVQTLLQRALVDARIDQHRHRAGLEQREHQQEEFGRRPHHQHRAGAADDAALREPCGDGVAACVQFGIAQGDGVRTISTRAAHRDLVGALAREPRQAGGDVAIVRHCGIVAAGTRRRAFRPERCKIHRRHRSATTVLLSKCSGLKALLQDRCEASTLHRLPLGPSRL